MDLSLITVSYFNDVNAHVEWLHPFYSSLAHEFSSSGASINHFIILNDECEVKAKRNIENVFSSYDLDFYSPFFIPVGNNPGLNEAGSVHHGNGFNRGLEKISDDYESLIVDSDLVVIEEFDVIHRRNCYLNLKNLCEFSKSFESFFGEVSPGSLKITNETVYHESEGLTTGAGDIDSEDGDLYLWVPRILPHFFGFHSSLFKSFLSKKSGFRDEVTDYASYLTIKDDSDNITFYNDTGSDLFKELLKEECFFHIKRSEIICHIKAITSFYDTILNSDRFDSAKRKRISAIENKFRFVKKKFDYLNFPEDSIFNREELPKNHLNI